MSKVLIVTAPSGGGKTTLIRHLLRVFPQLEFSVSACTRSPRLGEVDGSAYYFISVEEFRKLVAEDAFVEFEEVYPGSLYGTLKSELKKIWSHNKVVLFDVDVKGAVNLKKHFGEEALAIFIKPPSLMVLRQRLLSRATEPIEKIEIRSHKAHEEIKYEPYFDTVIINDKLDIAEMEIEKVVKDFLEK